MRALMGLAQTLVELGRVNEALAQFRELLRLNPNDNQGVRYPLLSELVRAQREDEAVAYVENFCDVWRETPGAVEWIQRQAITHKSGNRRHRGGDDESCWRAPLNGHRLVAGDDSTPDCANI